MVRSVEKAFRVLEAFDGSNRSLSLAQIGANVGLDKSASQRFTHTLTKLGYLQKDPVTKRFELSLRSLEMARHFITANPLVKHAMPYLLHLSRETEEAVNLTLPDGPEIVFAARFMSRHMLNTDVVVGTRMPAFCTAPGRAILSRLPAAEARALIERSPLQAFTPQTVHTVDGLVERLDAARNAGYATTGGEFFPGSPTVRRRGAIAYRPRWHFPGSPGATSLCPSRRSSRRFRSATVPMGSTTTRKPTRNAGFAA